MARNVTQAQDVSEEFKFLRLLHTANVFTSAPAFILSPTKHSQLILASSCKYSFKPLAIKFNIANNSKSQLSFLWGNPMVACYQLPAVQNCLNRGVCSTSSGGCCPNYWTIGNKQYNTLEKSPSCCLFSVICWNSWVCSMCGRRCWPQLLDLHKLEAERRMRGQDQIDWSARWVRRVNLQKYWSEFRKMGQRGSREHLLS